jgi:hypothetical protein
LFNSTQTEIQALLNILQSPLTDITACLANCSNQGICKLSQNQTYSCECNANFQGKSCQTDKRPCSQSNICLNNGTCVNSANLTSFLCKCNGPFYGQYCENMINLCENVTCSSHGYCTQRQNEIMGCKCFQGYEGDECDVELSVVKIVKNVQWTTTIICIICVALFWVIVVGSDLFNFLKIGQKKRVNGAMTEREQRQRFYYVP